MSDKNDKTYSAFANEVSTYKPQRKRRVWRDDDEESNPITPSTKPSVIENEKNFVSRSTSQENVEITSSTAVEEVLVSDKPIEYKNERRNKSINKIDKLSNENKDSTHNIHINLGQFESRANVAPKINKLSFGYTKFSNNLLVEILSNAELNALDIRILLIIKRFTSGYNLKSEYLSLSVVADILKSKNTTRVSHSINKLETLGLITRIKGTQYKPNKLGIDSRLDILTQNNDELKKTSLEVIGAEKNEKGPSLSDLLKNIKPKPIRDEARIICRDLLKKHNEEEILNVYYHLTTYGNTAGKKVYMPFRYMSVAMDSMLNHIKTFVPEELKTLTIETSNKEKEEISKKINLIYEKAVELFESEIEESEREFETISFRQKLVASKGKIYNSIPASAIYKATAINWAKHSKNISDEDYLLAEPLSF